MENPRSRASFSFKMAGVFLLIGVVSIIGVSAIPRPANGAAGVVLFLSNIMFIAFLIQGIYRLVKQSEQNLNQQPVAQQQPQVIIQQVPVAMYDPNNPQQTPTPMYYPVYPQQGAPAPASKAEPAVESTEDDE